jgi:glyoxylate/hydroxypyruvate reductase A
VRFALLSPIDEPDDWRAALRAEFGPVELDAWPGIDATASYDYVLAFRPPPGAVAKVPGARVVFSLGAGVDGLADDPTIPADLPIVRMLDPGLVQGMAEFVVHAVMAAHRDADVFAAAQREHRWAFQGHAYAHERTVGILGLGTLGIAAAKMLGALGFNLAGWSRTAKAVTGVSCYSGEVGLAEMLPRCDIVVCLLPLTPATRGILGARLFERLPQGAYVVNVGRGGHLVVPDLLAALAAGHLRGALLDVFETEPLPPASPLWDHPCVRVTPHIASVTMTRSSARYVAGQIRAYERGEPLVNLVDRSTGY